VLLPCNAEEAGLLLDTWPSGNSSTPWSTGKRLAAGLGALALLVATVAIMSPAAFTSGNGLKARASGVAPDLATEEEQSSFDELGRFVLRDYDDAKPWSSFLPGLGGKFGMPMWVSASDSSRLPGVGDAHDPQHDEHRQMDSRLPCSTCTQSCSRCVD
jgi:hypothetical protein